jgi:hypothetical protein
MGPASQGGRLTRIGAIDPENWQATTEEVV